MSTVPDDQPEIVRPPVTIGALAILAELLILGLWRVSVQKSVFLLPPFLVNLYFHNPIFVPLLALAIAIFGAVRRPTKFCLTLVFVAAGLVFVTPLLMDVEPEPLALPSVPNLPSTTPSQRQPHVPSRRLAHSHE